MLRFHKRKEEDYQWYSGLGEVIKEKEMGTGPLNVSGG
jgi:hypothetical protein